MDIHNNLELMPHQEANKRTREGHTCTLVIFSKPGDMVLSWGYKFTSTCKACIKEKENKEKQEYKEKQYQIENAEPINCYKCKIELPVRAYLSEMDGSYFYCLNCINKNNNKSKYNPQYQHFKN